MVKIYFALLLAAFAKASPKWNELKDYKFEQYVVDFNKNYSVEEYKLHEEAFNSRIQEFMTHNESGSTYKLGVSGRTDRIEKAEPVNYGHNKSLSEKMYNPFMSFLKADNF